MTKYEMRIAQTEEQLRTCLSEGWEPFAATEIQDPNDGGNILLTYHLRRICLSQAEQQLEDLRSTNSKAVSSSASKRRAGQ